MIDLDSYARDDNRTISKDFSLPPIPPGVTSQGLWHALIRGMPWRVLIVTGLGVVVDGSCPAAIRYAGGRHDQLIDQPLAALIGTDLAATWLDRAQSLSPGNRLIIDAMLNSVLERVVITVLARTDTDSVLMIALREAVEPLESAPAAVHTRLGDECLLDTLTPREREILGYIGNGMTSVQIADHLSRSIKTIEWHRVSLGRKLRIKSRVELAHLALRSGLSSARSPHTTNHKATQTTN